MNKPTILSDGSAVLSFNNIVGEVVYEVKLPAGLHDLSEFVEFTLDGDVLYWALSGGVQCHTGAASSSSARRLRPPRLVQSAVDTDFRVSRENREAENLLRRMQRMERRAEERVRRIEERAAEREAELELRREERRAQRRKDAEPDVDDPDVVEPDGQGGDE